MFVDDDGLSGLYGGGSQDEHDGELEGHRDLEARRPDSPGDCGFSGGQHGSQLGNPQHHSPRPPRTPHRSFLKLQRALQALLKLQRALQALLKLPQTLLMPQALTQNPLARD
jgi:hypothetical protein